MKFRAALPPAENYRLINIRDGRWVFEDVQTKALRIVSPVPQPWNQDWKILFTRMEQKSDRSQYPYRLHLRLYSLDEEPLSRARIVREEVKSIFSYSHHQPLGFWGFLTERPKIWVFYSVYRAESLDSPNPISKEVSCPRVPPTLLDSLFVPKKDVKK